MECTPLQSATLGEFVDLKTLLHSVEHTFPTQDSLRWFLRHHRSELIAAGALILIGGRLRFNPAIFQKAAVEIGRSAAGAR